jgi:methyl-accepting chemotaxis protein
MLKCWRGWKKWDSKSMSDTFAKMNVDIGADSTRLEKGLEKSKKQVDMFSAAINKAGKQAMGFFGGYMAFSTIAKGVINFSKSVLSSTDALAKQARRINASVREMYALDLAAQRGGASTEQMSGAFDKLNIVIGEAIQGGNSAQKSFSKMGLDAAALQAMTLTERVFAINNALKKMDKQAQAISLKELFGKGGGRFLGEGLADYQKALGDLRESPDIEKHAKRIEEINNAWTTAKSNAKMYFAEIIGGAIEWGGIIDDFWGLSEGRERNLKMQSDWLAMGAPPKREHPLGAEFEAAQQRMIDNENKLAQAAKTSADAHASWIEGISEEADRLNSEAIPAQEKLNERRKELLKMAGAEMITADAYALGMKKAQEEFERTDETAIAINKIMEEMTDESTKLRDEMAKVRGLMDAGHLAEDIGAKKIAAIKDQLNDLNPQVLEFRDYMAALERDAEYTFSSMMTPLEKLNAEMERLNEMKRFGVGDDDMIARAMEDITKRMQEADPEFIKIRDHLEELGVLAASVFDETRTPFERLVDELDTLDTLLAEGLIDMETALRKAGMEMDASGMFDTPATRRTEAGAVSAGGLMGLAAQANIGGIQSNERRMLDEQQRMRQLLEAIAINTQTKVIAYA